MAVVDTSVLVPLFDNRHAQHAKAVARLADVTDLGVVAPSLQELASVLRREGKARGLDGGQIARQAVARLRAQPRFQDKGAGVAAAACGRFVASPGLSLADCWAIEAALADGDELVTFDANQAKAWQAAKRAKPARS